MSWRLVFKGWKFPNLSMLLIKGITFFKWIFLFKLAFGLMQIFQGISLQFPMISKRKFIWHQCNKLMQITITLKQCIIPLFCLVKPLHLMPPFMFQSSNAPLHFYFVVTSFHYFLLNSNSQLLPPNPIHNGVHSQNNELRMHPK